jgi:hypothetical protein
MTLGELIEKIKNSDALTEEHKAKCLQLIPHLNVEQLRELADTTLWLEKQHTDLNNEEQEIISKVEMMFVGMNRKAIQIEKKEHYESMENDLEAQEEQELDSLIQEL